MSGKIDRGRTEGSLNSYNYTSLSSLRRALKTLLKLEENAFKGNEAALIILMDLKAGTDRYSKGPRVLTVRQAEVINLCLIEDLTEREAADELGISQKSINYSMNSALKRVRSFLVSGKLFTPVFTSEEVQELIYLYASGCKPMQIAEELHKPIRSIRNKLKQLKIDDLVEKKPGEID